MPDQAQAGGLAAIMGKLAALAGNRQHPNSCRSVGAATGADLLCQQHETMGVRAR